MRESIHGKDGYLAQIEDLKHKRDDALNQVADLKQKYADAVAARDTKLAIDERIAKLIRPGNAAPPEVLGLGKYVCTTSIKASTAGHFAELVEFGVRHGQTNGLAVLIAINQKITSRVSHWGAAPLRTDVPPTPAGAYINYKSDYFGDSGQVWMVTFSAPNISERRSEYMYVESDKDFSIVAIRYLEDIDALSDELKAKDLQSKFTTCPR